MRLLFQPFLRMKEDPIQSNKIPPHMNIVNITVVWKSPSCFRYIDMKVISKVLSSRIKTVTPPIIHTDEIGFIKAKRAYKTRRLFNIILQVSQNNKETIIVSLDIDKALIESTGHFYLLQKCR